MSEIDRHGWEIELLPLTKVMTREQCREIRPFFEKHGFTDFAYYRQYCSRRDHINKLIRHMENFIRSSNRTMSSPSHGSARTTSNGSRLK